MIQQPPNEIWQVEVDGRIYEAAFADLPEWIEEGSLQPGDKVRRGNLRWIEARRVPSLVPFFDGRTVGGTQRPVASVTDNHSPAAQDAKSNEENDEAYSEERLNKASTNGAAPHNPANSGHCAGHPIEPAAFVCGSCRSEFCKSCPSTYGSVRVCPACGSLCRSKREAAEKEKDQLRSSSFATESFGLIDLKRALAYPFKFRTSLFFGALMYVVLNIGQAASGIGGIVLVSASIFCAMLANMLTFGILANTVDNFTQGRFESDFMPAFDDFSLWNDVVHPFFLGIGVYISSFGPFILICLISVYMLANAAGEEVKKYNERLSRLPGTHYYAPDRTAEQSKEVRELLVKVKRQNERRFERQQRLVESAETGSSTPDTGEEERAYFAEQSELESKMEELAANRNGSFTAEDVPAGQTVPVSPDEPQELGGRLSGFLKLAAPLFVIGVLAFLWALLYFPAACAVAGYSRSIAATINPLVGLDTIKRLGFDYAKLLIFSALILIAATGVWLLTELLLFPFDLPRLGNIPSKAVTSAFGFYFITVFCCLLACALAKSAGRLRLYR